MGRKLEARPLCALVLTALAAVGYEAGGQNPPAGVTPGAVDPRLEERDRLERQRRRPGPAGDVVIDPVMERPLPMSGPQIRVQRFELVMPAAPELAPLRERVEEQLREELLAQDADGFYVTELENIAASVTNLLRNEGFVVSRAYLPEQSVSDGVVEIRVLEGRLGQVLAEGNERYSDATIEKPFQPLLGEPLQLQALESALLRLTDYPGLTPFGVLSPGERLGETDLTVRVSAEEPFDFSLTGNNFGNEFTGAYQAIGEFAWYNPTGAADALIVRVLQSGDPTNSTYGSLDYERPVFRPGLSVGGGILFNNYDVGRELADLGASGDTLIGNVFASYEFMRRRTRSAYVRVDLALKRADLLTAGELSAEDKLTVLGAEFGLELLDRLNGANQLQVRYDRGFADFLGSMDENGDFFSSRVGGDGTRFAGGNFNKFSVSYSRFQRLTDHQSLLLRLYGQYSSDLLVSLEQIALGGPYNVRAYAVSTALADSGGYATAEWIIDAPGFAGRPAWGGRTWGEIFSLSFFFDYAGGQLNDALPNDIATTDLSGVGAGFEFRFTPRSRLRVDVATALSEVPEPADDPQIYASFNITF